MEFLRNLLLLIQDQILGMRWLNQGIGLLLEKLGLDVTSRWGGSDLVDFLYSELFPTGAQPETSDALPWRWGEPDCRAAGHGDAVLFLFVDSALYWIYQRGAAVRRDVLISDFIADGGSGKFGFVNEYLRRKNRRAVCDHWFSDRGSRRDIDRKAAA